MKDIAWVLALGALILGCADVGTDPDEPDSSPTTVYRIGGLECRADSFESGILDYPEDAVGLADPEAEVAAFLDRPVNRRFQDLSLSERTGGRFSFTDEDGLVQLVIQLIEASRGYVVGSYSYCVDGD
jgi:hypothetical protein